MKPRLKLLSGGGFVSTTEPDSYAGWPATTALGPRYVPKAAVVPAPPPIPVEEQRRQRLLGMREKAAAVAAGPAVPDAATAPTPSHPYEELYNDW